MLQINILTFSIQISCCKTTHPTHQHGDSDDLDGVRFLKCEKTIIFTYTEFFIGEELCVGRVGSEVEKLDALSHKVKFVIVCRKVTIRILNNNDNNILLITTAIIYH